MFRKTWKTIKIIAVIAIIVICLPHSLLPKKENAESINFAAEQKKPNNPGTEQPSEKDTLEVR
jgi:hypothetical protein